DTATVAQPSRCPHALVRRPPTNSTTAPSAGKKISNHDAAIKTSLLPPGLHYPWQSLRHIADHVRVRSPQWRRSQTRSGAASGHPPAHKPLSNHSLVLQQVGVVD